MSRGRPPLPDLGLGPSNASDWATGDDCARPVYREGKWWEGYHYDTVRRDFWRDRERLRRNRAVRRFLGAQGADPGL